MGRRSLKTCLNPLLLLRCQRNSVGSIDGGSKETKNPVFCFMNMHAPILLSLNSALLSFSSLFHCVYGYGFPMYQNIVVMGAREVGSIGFATLSGTQRMRRRPLCTDCLYA